MKGSYTPCILYETMCFATFSNLTHYKKFNLLHKAFMIDYRELEFNNNTRTLLEIITVFPRSWRTHKTVFEMLTTVAIWIVLVVVVIIVHIGICVSPVFKTNSFQPFNYRISTAACIV